MTQAPHIASLAASLTSEQPQCPLCSRPLSARWLKKSPRSNGINEIVVCRKCRNAFASRRQLAYIIDAVLLELLLMGAIVVIGMLVDLYRIAASSVATVMVYWVGGWLVLPLLFCCKDGLEGQSPGKRICGIQVIDWTTREPIGFGRSLKRNLCLMIPYYAIILAFTLIKGWRAGDRWANTRVVWKKHINRLPFDPRGILCLVCGYNLTGNVSGRCPECGTPIRGFVPPSQADEALPLEDVASRVGEDA